MQRCLGELRVQSVSGPPGTCDARRRVRATAENTCGCSPQNMALAHVYRCAIHSFIISCILIKHVPYDQT